MTTFNYLTPLARVRPVPGAGFGSFAVAPIPAGTVVATFGGTPARRHEFDTADPDRRSRSIQIDDDLFLLGPAEREPGDCVNHSCEPNCGPRNATQIVAMRDIEIDEELTFDYGTTDGSDYDEFTCTCGAERCRGTISGRAWLDPRMREAYDGWFSPYLQRHIDASNRARELSKVDAEALLDEYDAEPREATARALRIVLGRPHSRFDDLVSLIPVDENKKNRLLRAEPAALDALVRELNETRGRNYAASPVKR